MLLILFNRIFLRMIFILSVCVYVHVFAACFSVHVRGSEYIPLLGSADADYPMLGLPGFEQ